MCLTLAIIWLSVKPIAVPAVVQVSSSQMEALIAKAELSQGTRNFASRLQYRHSAWVSSLETQGFKTAAWLLTWISRLPAPTQPLGFHCSSIGKESACNASNSGPIPGSGRSPGEGNGNPLQYSCLGHPMDRGAWWAAVHDVTKESDTTEWLNTHKHTRKGKDLLTFTEAFYAVFTCDLVYACVLSCNSPYHSQCGTF